MSMFIALTACRDREVKVWGPKSMVSFSPCSIARCCTKSAQIFSITSPANASSDKRTYHRSVRSIKLWCINSIICKVDNTYMWSMNDQVIPQLHEAPFKDGCGGIVETDTTWTGKGCSFGWYKFHDHTTYGWGILFVVHLVVDNRHRMLTRCTLW